MAIVRVAIIQVGIVRVGNCPDGSCPVTDCTQVDILCKNNQKTNEDLFIGSDARKLIISENITITENFYENVRESHSAACSYMVKTFPYHDEVLVHAEVADPSVRQEKSFESLNYFVTRFPAIMSGKSSE
ncbi:hypothetical protein HOLleu_10136 [Holothuria leucospilota]|uniref:Uncharacterized protein n=1 Tax=Holothuria leucospilota TaxID=206669 RepID=A0A9Q1CEG3_HOLLE|nr:hypothetical protein HOLleu_10136 [Holothuria leucospilota]